MRHRTHAFRRAAAAAVLGMGMTAGVIGLSAGIAGAATATNSITAASKLEIPTTGTNQPAGNLTVTLVGTTASSSGSTLLLTLATGTAGGTSVSWYATPTISSSGVNVTTVHVTATPTVLHITLGSLAAGTTATLTLTNVRYNTTAALGTVTVTATWTTTPPLPPFTPSSAVNAYATHVSPPTPATTISVKATSSPYLKATGNGQAAGNWTITVKGTATTGWNKTENIALTVARGANCTSAFGYILFTGTPTATVTAANVSTTPAVAVATSAAPTCSAVSHSQVTVSFTNTGTFTSTTPATDTMTIVLSGVKYNIAKGSGTGIFATTGAVKVTATRSTVTVMGTTKASTITAATASNGIVTSVYVTANTPAVTVAPSAYDAPISPVNLVENSAGAVSSGYVCIQLHTGTNSFNTSASATASATGGNGAVTAAVFYENSSGTKVTSGNATYAVFHVTSASTTGATTYSVSGLAVNATGATGTVLVEGLQTTATDCLTPGTTYATRVVAFTVGTTSERIAGATAAGTAAKELEHTFDPTVTHCVGTTGPTRPVVLATETHFQDALSSQYLAGAYTTGTLLTQTSSLPSVTVAALRAEGVNRVFVVGGTLAVSSTVVNELKSLPVYTCGGTALTLTTGTVSHIQVTRIYGHTAEDTAMEIAQAVPKSHIATLKFAGAYAGVNATGGNGMYNDTPAKASTGPATSAAMRTAIVASATEFQDAMAASAFAYNAHTATTTTKGVPTLLTTPMMLSTAAADALVNLTIHQVILMGGTDAVSNQVVTGLQTMGISVLRIAGMSYTDTAVQLAKFLVSTATSLGAGWTIGATSTTGIGTVTVTRGNGYTDGLAGAVISGHTAFPLLLTESPTAVGTSLTAFLKASGATTTGIATTGQTITSLIIFGGTLAVTPAVVAQMQADIA